MTKISIILPVYNGEKYIKKAIESVLMQSLDDFELIIINDGSTDNTAEIINSFDDKRIILLNQPNQGPGQARNNGLKIACGEYVMFLDSDDWFCKDALDIAYSHSKSNSTDITIFQIIKYYDGKFSQNDWFNLNSFDESFENRVFNPHECKDFLFDISVSACQKIFNREFLSKINANFPKGIYFEDMPFFFYTFLKSERISIIKKHLYVRQKHTGSITESVDSKFLDTVPAGQILIEIFIKNGWYNRYMFDLLAFKINGPRYALMEIDEKYKKDLYNLIKKDYESIKSTQYYRDYLENLGPIKKKFFLDILKSNDYEHFKLLNA